MIYYHLQISLELLHNRILIIKKIIYKKDLDHKYP